MARACLTVLLIALLGASPAAAQIYDVLEVVTPLDLTSVAQAGKRQQQTLSSPTVSDEFNGIALQGHTDEPMLEGWVRFTDGETWGTWHPLYIVRSATDGGFLAAYRSETYRIGQRYEVRFDVDADTPLHLLAAGTFNNKHDVDGGPPPRQQPLQHKGTHTTNVIPPSLITRTDWGAESFRGTPIPLGGPNITKMTFHHAAGFSAETLTEGLAQVKAIQEFHQNGRGWSDIGYQFVVDKAGNVYQGRPFLDDATTLDALPALARGAHVGGANTGNIGICLLGCYHPPETAYPCNDIPTEASLEAMTTMFAFFSEVYDIDPFSNLFGHRDQGSTSCPGDNNYERLPQMRTEVEFMVINGNANDLPTSFAIEQNAPNPVSQQATIRYFVPQAGRVAIRLYDALGRERATLVDAFLDEGNRWLTTTLDASGLADGVYYYRILVEGFSGVVFDETRSLVVVH